MKNMEPIDAIERASETAADALITTVCDASKYSDDEVIVGSLVAFECVAAALLTVLGPEMLQEIIDHVISEDSKPSH